MKRISAGCAVLLGLAMTCAQAAVVYDFYVITSDTNAGYRSIASQMSMQVVSAGSDSATLLFSNTGDMACTIEEIFFNYGPVDAYAGTLGLTIPDGWVLDNNQLPGGSGFFTTDFSLAVIPPSPMNGITLGGSLEVILNYGAGFDILTALNNGELRIGLHTISIIDMADCLIADQDRLDYPEMNFKPEDIGELWNYSESSINNIPEPASMVLMVISTVALGFTRRTFMV